MYSALPGVTIKILFYRHQNPKNKFNTSGFLTNKFGPSPILYGDNKVTTFICTNVDKLADPTGTEQCRKCTYQYYPGPFHPLLSNKHHFYSSHFPFNVLHC